MLHPEVVRRDGASIGYDLSGRTPRQLEPQADAAWADVVVTMGCGDVCPVLPGKRYVDWELEDPAGKPIERVRELRDEIERRVAELARQLDSIRDGLCLNDRVEAQVEELGGDTVRLTVDVPAHDVHHAVEHATTDLASSVKIPGFRAGKVPRPVLVQRLGKERIYAEAVDSHISGWFWNAAARARIRPVAQPQYEYELPTEDDAAWQFTATVPVQPKVEVVDWTEPRGRAARRRGAGGARRAGARRAARVGRRARSRRGPARSEGDTLVVDIVSPDGEAQRDTVVELGAGRLVDEVEAALVGASAGETKSVPYELADESTRHGRGHRQGDQGEGAARARRRARALRERVRHDRRAARRHRATPARRRSRPRSRTRFGRTRSTRSSPPRTSRRPGRSSSRARASS